MMVEEGKSYQENKKIRIGICDDSKKRAEYIHSIAAEAMKKSQYPNEIIMFTNPLELIAAGEQMDILFLDIEMPQMDGLEAAAKMNAKHRDIKIIYLTSHAEYMQEAFKVKAYRYLFKSSTKEEIEDTLLEAVTETMETNGILVEVNHKMLWIFYKDIVCVEALGDEVALHLPELQLCLKKSLSAMGNQLGSTFYQCHKSYLVNLLQIQELQEREILLKNGEKIPRSIRKRKELKNAYFQAVRENAKYL